jgi:sodium transport system permease protein
MRGALLILRKEYRELAKDRKTLFFTFVLPLILYPAIFGMTGGMGDRDAARRAARPSRICLADPSGLLEAALRADPAHFTLVPPPAGDVRQALRGQQLDLALEVDPDAAVLLRDNRTLGLRATYDGSDDTSRLALDRFKGLLSRQESSWIQERLRRLGAPPELAVPVRLDAEDAGDLGLQAGKMIGSFLPYLLMLMMYAGAMQHGIYATAGEKERGTLLALLATRLSRTQIIVGKLLYIFSIGILSALVNLLSMGVSVARMLHSSGAAGPAAAAGIPALATPSTLLCTFVLMVPLGLFFANFILLGGLQARNTLEASTALTPGIVVVLLLGVFSMAPGIEKLAFLPYVPVLNVSLAIRKLFSRQADPLEYLVALGMTLALAALMTWISTRLLDRESNLFRA